ncbi:unnamed protein product [Cyprideis torosa]|uniref:Uncharacterized protein n=1 Tax=Cyprideis torosa TaxID=163714 RepID=A0A7R8ZYV2_9CRUS|nr:unnamed protein product [Cyprideis torosa]CAG0908882.1 unnamed protein product [Cyprideis torosa]
MTNGNTSFGVFRGLILRSQLITLLKERAFNERPEFLSHAITRDTFRADYPRYPDIRDVEFLSDELEYTMDLRPFMGPAPYTVYYCASLPRIFKLFRGLGLRHLVVINDAQEVVGIVTRKDLARFRVWKHRCQMGLEELVISEKI